MHRTRRPIRIAVSGAARVSATAASIAPALAMALTFAASPIAHAFTAPPLAGHVTDVAGALSTDERTRLESWLDRERAETRNEIAVLVLPSLDGSSMEDAAYETFNAWRLGQKGADNGVLLLIALKERLVRIETGKGVEGALTDLQSHEIIRTRIAPHLRAGRTAEGVRAGVEGIAAALRSQPPAPDTSEDRPVRPAGRGWSGLLVVALFVLIMLLRAGSSRRYRRRFGAPGPWWFGGPFGGPWVGRSGGFGGFGGGGFGGGGFRGGGGRSGGGGATGRF